MTTIVFAGPSLPPADRAAFPELEWRPPAQAGDLLRLDLQTTRTVCLIDGYFDHRPAVRHKEILLLLSEGVRVFGASSIGALRAAEMADFGMIGIGAIYRAYARNLVVGDDEVALVHAPAEHDWRPISVPLVDVRATVCRAVRGHIIQPCNARALLRAASGIHYVDRDWPAILRDVDPFDAHDRLRMWLPTGAVAQKHLDALDCLAAARTKVTVPRPLPIMVRTPFLDVLERDL